MQARDFSIQDTLKTTSLSDKRDSERMFISRLPMVVGKRHKRLPAARRSLASQWR